ncbi:MAG: hypothetical protein QM733_05935 [Ilumatobacteraceae bacterium]
MSSRVLGLFVVLASAAIVGGSFVGDAVTTQTLINDEIQLRQHGGYLFTVSPPDDTSGDIPPNLTLGKCDMLTSVDGVAFSGAFGVTHEERLLSATDQRVGIIDMSAGLRRVLSSIDGRPIPADSFIADNATAEAFGITDGAALAIGSQPPTLVVLRDIEVLSPALTRAVLQTAAPNDHAVRCFIAQQPGSPPPDPADIAAALGSDRYTVRPTNPSTVLLDRPQHEFDRRTIRFIPWLAALIMAAVAAMVRWSRRSERGLYLALGIDRPTVRLVYMLESALATITGASLGIVAGAIVAWQLDARSPAVLPATGTALATASACLLGSMLINVPSRRNNTLANLKDR